MTRTSEFSSARRLCATALIVALLTTSAAAQVTSRVSVSTAGGQPNGASGQSSITPDGRYVVFYSSSTNLISGDTNGAWDVFVRDRQLGTTERVSVDSSGVPGNDSSHDATISPDGRFVAFESWADNLVAGDTNGKFDVFVRDRQLGTTERVNVDSSGVQANAHSLPPLISDDGRYVFFSSHADNLVALDTNGHSDVFLHDRQSGITERLSVGPGGVQAIHHSYVESISPDGRYVAFNSLAANLVGSDTNGAYDVFVLDRQSGVIEIVSVDSSGAQANDHSSLVSISADGRCVAFSSFADNLAAGDTNGVRDVFVHDRQSGLTECVSVDSNGQPGNGESYDDPSISGDGRYVTFSTYANNLPPGDANATVDVFLRDRHTGVTDLVSVASSGVQGNYHSSGPSISPDGRYVAFTSYANNLVPGDTSSVADIFVRDRLGGPSFASLCDPGASGVISCPCANPPSAAGRGCDNSSGTGGARISAAGGTILTSDSLVFTTSGEKPTATSIVLQGDALTPAGTIYGQGVRCAGGSLKRLYTKAAVGGSITAPNFGAGDSSVSARSAALGSTILPAQTRWYLVYYRDPVVLGGCPSISTFNATQTGEVVWLP